MGVQVKRTDPEPPRPRHYRLYFTPTTQGLEQVTLPAKSLSLLARALLSQVKLYTVVLCLQVCMCFVLCFPHSFCSSLPPSLSLSPSFQLQWRDSQACIQTEKQIVFTYYNSSTGWSCIGGSGVVGGGGCHLLHSRRRRRE